MRYFFPTASIWKPTESSVFWIALIAAFLVSQPVSGQTTPPAQKTDAAPVEKISPARKINHPAQRTSRKTRRPQYGKDEKYRTIDGSNNNQQRPEMGTPHTSLFRLVSSDYTDGISALAGKNRPSARLISNHVFSQGESIPNSLGASDYLWQWGQFLDHDIDLSDGTDPAEPANIPVPTGDPYFDPYSTGNEEIALNRSIYDKSTGTDTPRQQLNEITTWIDASNVYGSDQARADALRTFDGDGKLRTSEGNLLPFNTTGLPNAGGGGNHLFLAGDVRANEQTGLTALHILFVREHNRLAELIAEKYPGLSGDEIYQKARKLVGAEMQMITYREYLPALLGPAALAPYRGYDPSLDASIANIFSAAAYRYGHSALNTTLLRLDENGQESPYGNLALRDAFFNPSRIIDEGGIEPILRGLAVQKAQAVDTKVVDDVRNFLFGPPGAGGFDLASLNIQRGRDHGLPSYNDVREAIGFSRAEYFSDISSDTDIQARLSSVYDSTDDIDLWVGGLAEDTVPGSHLGPTFHSIIKNQFEALRDGDRYWYVMNLSREERKMIQRLRLSDIIRLNTGIGNELQKNVFRARPKNRSKNQRRKSIRSRTGG